MLATNINKELLLKVMKVADVYEFTIAKTGEKPVDMVSVEGKKYKLTIDELTRNFTTLQGKPIRIIRLTKNKQYLATKLQSTPCYAVKVPRNSTKHIDMPDGQVVGPGKVIVIHADKLIINGDTVDISAGTVMSESFFRKTCVLKEISEAFKKQLATKGILTDDTIKPMETPTNTAKSEEVVTEPAQVTQTTEEKPIQAQQSASATHGIIVSVIKNADMDVVIGYNVQLNGNIITLDVEHTLAACDEGLIGNATSVTNGATGKRFLRGIGVRLEDLPVVYA